MDAQSVSALQVVLHVVVSAHFRRPEHAEEVPGVQLPAPLQVPAVVNTEFLHDVEPHTTALPGKTHCPVPSHAVAPQAPEVAQAAAQQLPVPAVPHTPVVHWLLELHG
jgi:hypothetical protein